MDFILKIPIDLRVNSRIYIKMIETLFPTISKIPWQKTGMPLTASNLQLKIHKKIKGAKRIPAIVPLGKEIFKP